VRCTAFKNSQLKNRSTRADRFRQYSLKLGNLVVSFAYLAVEKVIHTPRQRYGFTNAILILQRR